MKSIETEQQVYAREAEAYFEALDQAFDRIPLLRSVGSPLPVAKLHKKRSWLQRSLHKFFCTKNP
jgi:hypothetical protein